MSPPPSVIKWPLHQQHQMDFAVHSQAANPETCAAVLVATLLLLLCLPYKWQYSGASTRRLSCKHQYGVSLPTLHHQPYIHDLYYG